MLVASVLHVVWIAVGTVLLAGPLLLSMWALLDAARRPQWAWAMTAHRQVVWMAAILFGVFLTFLGVGISAWYLLRVRPVVAAAEDGRPA